MAKSSESVSNVLVAGRAIYLSGKLVYCASFMEIAFRTGKIKRLCERRAEAQRRLGKASAKKLGARLSDLEAAASVADLVAGRPHPLSGDWRGQFALDLAGGRRLVFSPDLEPAPVDADGAVQWARVTRVCIEFIGDYHD